MKDDRLFLIHIQESAQQILVFTAGGWESFNGDRKTQDAVIRNFEIIGEAAKRLSDGTKAKAPKVPWRQLAGFRDVLIHQYDIVDPAVIWKNIEKDLPDLLRAVERLLAELRR